MREASKKITGGKLVKMRRDEKTGRVTIHGDFFLHPEESVFALEDLLSGLPPSTGEGKTTTLVTELMQEEGIQAVGFVAGDLASLFSEVAH